MSTITDVAAKSPKRSTLITAHERLGYKWVVLYNQFLSPATTQLGQYRSDGLAWLIRFLGAGARYTFIWYVYFPVKRSIAYVPTYGDF